MITVQQVEQSLFDWAPRHLAESWDNVGHLVGDPGREVHRILVSLDITEQVVQEAVDGGFDLIVSHHPVIFSPLKKLGPRDVSFQLVQSGICRIVCVVLLHRVAMEDAGYPPGTAGLLLPEETDHLSGKEPPRPLFLWNNPAY